MDLNKCLFPLKSLTWFLGSLSQELFWCYKKWNGTKKLLLAMKPQVSLAFQAVFLKSVLAKQKAAEGKASRLHLKILKKAIPCTLRNVLGPAVFPPSPLLPSGA